MKSRYGRAQKGTSQHPKRQKYFKTAAIIGSLLLIGCNPKKAPEKEEGPPKAEVSAAINGLKKAALEVCEQAGPGLVSIVHPPLLSERAMVVESEYLDCQTDGTRLHTEIVGFTFIHFEKDGFRMSKLVNKTEDARKINLGVEEPKTVDEEELIHLAKDKKIVVLGEHHTKTEDNEAFLRLVPKLREVGYEWIGLEYPSTWQHIIDDFASKPDKNGREKLYSDLAKVSGGKATPYEFATFVEATVESGMQALLFDHPSAVKGTEGIPKRETLLFFFSDEREKYMQDRIATIAGMGKKIAVFVGLVHATTAEKFVVIDKGGGVESFGTRLGSILKKQYGKDQVLVANIAGCQTSFTDVCLKTKPNK